MKLPDRLSWHIASHFAARNRRQFAAFLETKPWESPAPCASASVPLQVVSFSGLRDLPEQALSIASFLRWVGAPREWIVYSDGTHTGEAISRLKELHVCVQVRDWAQNPPSDSSLASYAAGHPLGKKIAAYSGHALDGPALFVDSDVVFYGRAGDFLSAALGEGRHWYSRTSGGARWIPATSRNSLARCTR